MAEIAVRVETHEKPYTEVTGETRAVFDTVVAGVVGDNEFETFKSEGRPALAAEKAVCVSILEYGFGPTISHPTRGIFADHPVDEGSVEEAIERLLSGEDRKQIATFMGFRAVGQLQRELDRISEGDTVGHKLYGKAKAVKDNLDLVLAELGPEAAEPLGQLLVEPATSNGV